METLSIKLDNGNAKTIVSYDEKKSSLFWSQQSTNSYHAKSEDFVSNENATSSFDKQLQIHLKDTKHNSRH
jgi:hypothetical protein